MQKTAIALYAFSSTDVAVSVLLSLTSVVSACTVLS